MAKEARHIRRDPKGLAFVLALPFIMIFIYGTGINFDVRDVRTAVVDLSGGIHAARLVRKVAASGTFKPVSPEPRLKRGLGELRYMLV